MSSFVISFPGTTSYKAFAEDPVGLAEIDFVSFDGNTHYSAQFRECGLSEIEITVLNKTDLTVQKTAVEYQAMVSDTIDHIVKQNLGKIVLSRFEDHALRAAPLDIYNKLVTAYPNACVYLFSHKNFGTWIGATPEVLLMGNEDKVQTMSLAGTKVAGNSIAMGEKEQEEQRMVTDFIVDSFKGVEELSEVSVSEPHGIQAGNLVHLRTDIAAVPQTGFSPQKLIQQLHPTPAVAGLPRAPAMKYLAEFEDYKREFYAGYFGIKETNQFSYFVNLRCMQMFNKEVRLYAGGGITAESDPHSEWLETEHKLRTIGDILR